MKQTVYVDVLIIINIYINYGLLLLTCFFMKLPTERVRILIASFFGGLYSLIILTDINDALISVSRVPALAVMVFMAFRRKSLREYLKTAFGFFGVNLLFAGAMFALWFFFCPENMYYNSGVVYFGVDALTLVAMTVAVYIVIRLAGLLRYKSPPQDLSYTMSIYLSGKEFICRGFYDTGNCLRDPFGGEGVTVVNIDVFSGIVSKDIFRTLTADGGLQVKLIPVKTLSGTRVLPSLRVEKIILKSYGNCVVLDKPMIALTDEKIHGGAYGALLSSFVFENTC